MKRSKRFLLVAAASALSLVAAACGGGDGDGGTTAAGDGDCTLKVGTIGALSGDFANIGQPIFQGVKFAVDQANEAGDLPCQIEIHQEDSQGSPDQAPPLAQALVQDEQVFGIVGPYFSGETLATGEIFNEAGVAFICPSCTNETIDDQGWDAFFRAVANDGVQGPTAAEFIRKNLQPNTVAVVHDNQDYSKGLADTVANDLKESPGPRGDITVAGPFVINPEETDYSAVVSKVKNADPDVVYYGGYVPQAPQLLKQLSEAGVNAQFVSDDGAKDASFGELAGDAAQGAIVTCPCVDPTKVEGAQDFVNGMQEQFGQNAPGTFAADAFDATNILLEALRNVDDPTGDINQVRQQVLQFVDQLEGYNGVAKTYTFGDNGEVNVDPLQDIWIYEFDTDQGNFVSKGPAADLI